MSTDPTPMPAGSTPMPGEPPSLPALPSEDDGSFAKIREAGAVYVDKTRFIQRMVSGRPHTFFCAKPRRFGKTLMVSTLEAFFQGKKELFRGLDIEEYMESPAFMECPVIRFDMSTIPFTKGISGLEKGLLDEIGITADNYGLRVQSADMLAAFRNLIQDAYRSIGPAALLIDEYDYQLVCAREDVW